MLINNLFFNEKKDYCYIFFQLFLWMSVRVWFKVTVLKTVVEKSTVGSNPTSSAIIESWLSLV